MPTMFRPHSLPGELENELTPLKWRNLIWHKLTGGMGGNRERDLVLKLLARAEALEAWRLSLMNERPAANSSRFRQHFFAISPDYDLRHSAGIALCNSGEHVFTFTRFGLFAILGIIENWRPGSLTASEVKIGGGRVNGVQVMPPSLIRYLHIFDVSIRRAVRESLPPPTSVDLP